MKIPRVLQKIFGSNPSGLNQFGKIGSMAAGTPEYTTDPTEMQSYENFEEGLYGIVLGNKSPAIQDINSMYHLLTRQIAYLLQQGVAEWDSLTDYHLNSIVSVDGLMYSSLQNDNIGHAVTDELFWKEQGMHFDARLINGNVVPFKKVNAPFLRVGSGDTVLDVVSIKFHPKGQFVIMIDNNSGSGLQSQPARENLYNDTGSGPMTFSAQPAGVCSGMDISSDGRFLAVGTTTTPWVHFYDITGSVGTKLANPASLPATGSTRAVKISPNGELAIFAGSLGCNMAIYKRSNDGWRKLAAPASLPTVNSDSLSVEFSPDGKFVAIGTDQKKAVEIYSITYTPTFADDPVFTKLTNTNNISVNPAVATIAWHPDGRIIAFGGFNGVNTYEIISGVVTPIAQPNTTNATAGFPSGLKWSADGKTLIVGTRSGTTGLGNIRFYKLTGDVLDYVTTYGIIDLNYAPVFDIDNRNEKIVHSLITGSPYNPEMAINPNTIDVKGRTPRILYEIGDTPIW